MMVSADAIMEELRGMVAQESLSPFVRRRIEVLYEQVFGRRFVRTSCRDCYRDAVLLMYNHIKKGLPMNGERQFILRRGVLIQPTFGGAKFYTASTITDEVARAYLREHPEDVRFFEKVGDIDMADAASVAVAEVVDEGVVAAVAETADAAVAVSRKKSKTKSRSRR